MDNEEKVVYCNVCMKYVGESKFNKDKNMCNHCIVKIEYYNNYNNANAISYIETQLTSIKDCNHKYRILKAAAEQTINFYVLKLKEIEEKHKNEIDKSEKYIENSLEVGIKEGYLEKEITCITAVIKKEKKGISIKWI
jgi:hypothetical protein